eukprot:14065168-Alexandrium_andersonii.AAC.1
MLIALEAVRRVASSFKYQAEVLLLSERDDWLRGGLLCARRAGLYVHVDDFGVFAGVCQVVAEILR